MFKKVSQRSFALFLMSALVLPISSARVQAGDGLGAFAAGAFIGAVAGAIAGDAKKRKTYRPASGSRARTTNYRSSAQREENKNIQRALNLYGYKVGTVDGALGRKSKAAIQKFQAINGFAPTGSLNDYEKQLLLSTPFQIEQNLYQQGFSVGVVDGRVDQQTKIAISQFQSKVGQMPTGELTANQSLQLIGTQQPMMAAQPGINPQMNQPAMQQANQQAAGANTSGYQQTNDSLSTLPPIQSDGFAKNKIRNDNAVAVIIGNRTYTGKDIPDVEYAERDAEAMKYIFMNTLGVPEENVIYIENATLSVLVDTFGNETPDQSLLWSYIDPDGESDVYVYYSGHGVPSLSNKGGQAEAYIAPTDILSTSSIQSSYALAKLYDNLQALPTKSVTVFIDACFSGAAGNGDMIIPSASPIVIPAYAPQESGQINVFAAAKADQIASWNEKIGHGIFTASLVEGLSGKADMDDDSAISTGELENYLRKEVHRSARRSWRRDQTPTFEGDLEQVLVKY